MYLLVIKYHEFKHENATLLLFLKGTLLNLLKKIFATCYDFTQFK